MICPILFIAMLVHSLSQGLPQRRIQMMEHEITALQNELELIESRTQSSIPARRRIWDLKEQIISLRRRVLLWQIARNVGEHVDMVGDSLEDSFEYAKQMFCC